MLYDDNHISIDGDTALAYSDDVLKRFSAYGWAAKRIDGHDPQQIEAALSFAVRSKRPTVIACRTIIGLGAPTKAGTAATHGSPLGPQEAAAAKAALGWHEPAFTVPAELLERWHAIGSRGATARRAWLKRLAHNAMRGEFERVMAGRLPDNWHDAVAALKQDIAETKPRIATRQASQKALDALVPATPELVGGSADLTGSNLTFVKTMGTVSAGNFAGRYIHFGVREHGMAAAANGMAVHGGLIPYTGTFFIFTDYMRPAIRIGAIMRAHVIHVLTHDSIGLGEDGPTHQPIEHLASLRAMPHLHVYRPAEAMETAECWELAIRRTDGPSLLVLTRQALPTHAHRHRREPLRAGRLRAGRGGRPAPGHADRHRLGGFDRHGRPGEPCSRGRRGCGRVTSLLGAVLAAGRGVSCRGAGRRAAHRHRGRQRVRLGALARQ